MLTAVVLQWALWSQYRSGTMQALLWVATALPYILLGRVFGLKRSLEQVTWPVSAMLTGLLTPAIMGAGPFLAWSGLLSLGAVALAAWASGLVVAGTIGRAGASTEENSA